MVQLHTLTPGTRFVLGDKHFIFISFDAFYGVVRYTDDNDADLRTTNVNQLVLIVND